MDAFLDYSRILPCVKNKPCEESCPFYPFSRAFDISCAGFCVDYPKAAAYIMGLEIVEESEKEE